ncbi:MAG: hypothetical protein P8O16_12890 [Algoriphagus sp.]|uniref:hypothetical protein n=1 Tax=Algoriphagus sp. TaxID=1872435 RepID=UPI00262E3FB3|nr:hypothetical protein [Algoriphagus sp.]MDG1278171.1 hypothetical protein [Algoriphagus sp.]
MRKLILFIVSILFSIQCYSQNQKDSTKISITQKALGEGLKLITRTGGDSVLVENSEDRFLPFEGKIIRNIYIESIGFEKSIYGNDKAITQKIGRAANKLHTNTREKTIRQHLFIHPNDLLNPYKLGDNERFLRNKDFILESRFVITPIDNSDSVDVTIVTRDVFSIGLSAGGSFPSAPKFNLYDANLDGRAQRIEFNFLFDQDRKPKTGFGASFKKSSFLGSFADLEFFYTQLNSGFSYGDETEYATGIIIDRQLVSPYSRMAGGVQLSKNWSRNVYSRPDSSFLDYSYNLVDLWAGYNFGAKKKIQDRNRAFLALRVFDGYYSRQPDLEGLIRNRIYNNASGVLAAMTFYKRDFFKTQYVFGFGRTEDVPYGYSITPTFGLVRQLRTQRPYAAIKLEYNGAFSSGSFYDLEFNVSSYFRNSSLEDAVFTSNISYATKVFTIGRFKIRNSAMLNYTQLFNVFANDWLQIDSSIIPGLRVEELDASKRNSLGLQTIVFTPWSIIGFRIAPFTAVNWAMMKCSTCEEKNNIYTGISAGMRIRNENLIFGTMELKATYIPNDESGDSKFSFSFRQNLRFRKTDVFVTAPSLNRYNN